MTVMTNVPVPDYKAPIDEIFERLAMLKKSFKKEMPEEKFARLICESAKAASEKYSKMTAEELVMEVMKLGTSSFLTDTKPGETFYEYGVKISIYEIMLVKETQVKECNGDGEEINSFIEAETRKLFGM